MFSSSSSNKNLVETPTKAYASSYFGPGMLLVEFVGVYFIAVTSLLFMCLLVVMMLIMGNLDDATSCIRFLFYLTTAIINRLKFFSVACKQFCSQKLRAVCYKIDFQNTCFSAAQGTVIMLSLMLY